jgi:hypothetical protein
MTEVNMLKRIARRCWLPLLGAAALLGGAACAGFWQYHAITRGVPWRVAEAVLGIAADLAIFCGIVGTSCLLVRLLMSDEGPSDRAQTVYVVVFCAMAAVNYLVHAELGSSNWWGHPAWTRPWTVTGMFGTLLGRALSEAVGGPRRLYVLPFSIFVHACLWLPLLLGGRGRWGWLRAVAIQAVWGGIWVAFGLVLCREVYWFHS